MVRETRYLIVRNLPENCTEETVIEHFQRYGRIQSVKLQAAKDNESGSTATVAFNDIKSAAKAHNAKNILGELTLRTDYWEASTSTPVIATPPATSTNANRSANYTSATAASTRPVSTFTNWTKGSEDDSSAIPDKGDATPVQTTGVTIPATTSATLDKLSSAAPFDLQRSRGRDRLKKGQKKFGQKKFEKNGSFGRHGTTTSSRSLEAARSQSEAAAAAAAASTNSTTPSIASSAGLNSTSGSTAGLNPIIVSDTKDISSNREIKENIRDSALSRPHSVASPSSRHSGLKKSLSQSRSASPSRSRSRGSKSSSSRSDSSGTSRSTSPHRSYTSSTARPQSMVGASRLVSSEVKEAKKDENDGERRPLGICVTGLPMRSTDSSLRDGLYHEYKKHGKVTTVQICVDGDSRCAIVSFRKPEDASKALEASQGKIFFGAKIKVTSHEGVEVDDADVTNDNDSLDEYHVKSTRTLFVGNLEKETTTQDLIEKFKAFGEIIDVDIKRQGATTAFAFVQYVDITSVVGALRAMEGEHIGINKIKLGFGKSMPTCCVWVDNLPADITNRTLRSSMTRYGEITYCLVDKNRNKGLIYFNSYDDAQHCVTDIKMRPHFMKKKLQIDFASRECQTNFLDRMEESGLLRANERPDESRVHNKFRQQRSFDGFTEEASPSSFSCNSRTTASFSARSNGRSSRRGRPFVESGFTDEAHTTPRRSRRPDEFSNPSSSYYSSKGSGEDYDAVLREYGHSQRERRERDLSPRHSSADRRVDGQSRRSSRDRSLDRYEERSKDIFNNRDASPSSDHNSYHSDTRYRSSRDDKYSTRDRYEDRKSEDKDFDRQSRPSRAASPFLQNHTSLHSHSPDYNRRGGSRSQSPPTPLQEESAPRYFSDDYKRSVVPDEDYDYLPSKRRDSDDVIKTKNWSLLPSTKLGAEVAKTVEKSRKRTHEESGLSEASKLDAKLLRKLEKSSTTSDEKLKSLNRSLGGSKSRVVKGLDHAGSPGSSGSHGDSENGSVSEGDLHHLHQEKKQLLLALQGLDEEVVDTSEPESLRSIAKIRSSVAVKNALRVSGRIHEDKKSEDTLKNEAHRKLGDKPRRLDIKRENRNNINDDFSCTREEKGLLGDKEESAGGHSDSDLDIDLRNKKRRTDTRRDSDSLKNKGFHRHESVESEDDEQNTRLYNPPLDRRASCDNRTNSLSSKFYENKLLGVSSPCDNGDPFKGGLSDKDNSVIKNRYRNFPNKDWNSESPEHDAGPLGDFSPVYSENTRDSVNSGSLTEKRSPPTWQHSLPSSPMDNVDSDNDYSNIVPDIVPDDSFSDDSLGDPHIAAGEASMEERIRALDEMISRQPNNKIADPSLFFPYTSTRNTNNNENTADYPKKYRTRKRFDLEGGNGSVRTDSKPEPSVIMHKVLSKTSILDQDFKRLEQIKEIYEPSRGKEVILDIPSSKLLEPGVKPYLFSLSHPVTTSSSMLQPTITTSLASSASLTAPISTSVLTTSIVSAPITTSSISVSPKDAAVDNLLKAASESTEILSNKHSTCTNLLTLKQDVLHSFSSAKPVLTSHNNNSLSSKSIFSTTSVCSSAPVSDTNLLPSQTITKSSSHSLLPLSQQPVSSSVSCSSTNSHPKSNLQQNVTLPVTCPSSTKSPAGAPVAAPFTQGPDKSQLTPTVGQEAPRLCSPSFTPENSRTSSHLPGSPRVNVESKETNDQLVPNNKPDLTISVSGSTNFTDESSKSQTCSKSDITPDIESPVSVKSETSSNSSVPLSSLDNKNSSALEEKSLLISLTANNQSSNNELLAQKSLVALTLENMSSGINKLSPVTTMDTEGAMDLGTETSSLIKGSGRNDAADFLSSRKPELPAHVTTHTVLSVNSKEGSDKKEILNPLDISSSVRKGVSSSMPELDTPLLKPSLPTNVTAASSSSTSRSTSDRNDKKPGKSNSHIHSKSPAKAEALFAPDMKVEQPAKPSEKTDGKLSKDSHKTSNVSKSSSSSNDRKVASKTSSKDSHETKDSGTKEQDKAEKKSETVSKGSTHESKSKESDKNKVKDKKDNKEGEKVKQKEKDDSKKKEEKKVSDKKEEKKSFSIKEDKKSDSKMDEKKDKSNEKDKSRESSKQNILKKVKQEVDPTKKDKKQKPKESSGKEKVSEKKAVPNLAKQSNPPREKVETKDSKLTKSDSKESTSKDSTKSEQLSKTDQKAPSKPDKHKTGEAKSLSRTSSETKPDTKDSSSASLSKKPTSDAGKIKKEGEKDSTKQSSIKQDKSLKHKSKEEDRQKEKQKIREEKEKQREDKLKEEKEKQKEEMEKRKEEKEKQKEEKEKLKEEKEKLREEREKQREEKEKEEREQKEREEKERQKEREEKERKEREEQERKEQERKEREEKERLRKEKEEKERQKEREREERERKEEKLRKEREEKELQKQKERDAQKEKEKLEKERKEKEEKERLKEKEEKEKQKEDLEKAEKDKQKERERKEKERKEKEKREKREKEKKAKEEKLKKEKEEKAKKEKEEKSKREEKEKAKKEKAEKKEKEKQKNDKDEDDDDDEKDKERKKPPPKKPKRNELAVLLDSNDRFQMTFTSMYDRVKTQRNREPEMQHKSEPAPKSSFDKFKQNRKKNGSKAKSSLYSFGSTSELSDDSDLSLSESSQKADSVKDSKPKKTNQIKKRPHVSSSSSSSSCEEDDVALLTASKLKSKKLSDIFSSDSEEDNFQPPSKSKTSKSKTKPAPKRRKTRDDSTDSMASRDEFVKPHAISGTHDLDSLDDIDMSDEEDIPKKSKKKSTKLVKKAEHEKRDSSVESVSKKPVKKERESSVESVSKKSVKSEKESTPIKKLKPDSKKTTKHEGSTEAKSAVKDTVKAGAEDKKKGKISIDKEKKKDLVNKKETSKKDTDNKKIVESRKEIDNKKEHESTKKDSDNKKEVDKKDAEIKKETDRKEIESKKDSSKKELDVKKESEFKREPESKKDSDRKDLEADKVKSKEKVIDDVAKKHAEERKKKKDKDDGPVKKKKKKKYDPKEEEEKVNSLITKVYDKALEKEKKQKKQKINLLDSDSDLGLSDVGLTVADEVMPLKDKLELEIHKPKEKKKESSKEKDITHKEIVVEKDSSKDSKHSTKESKVPSDTLKKAEFKRKEEKEMLHEILPEKAIDSHKRDKVEKKDKTELITEIKPVSEIKAENILDEVHSKPPKKKKKKKEHEKDSEREKEKSSKSSKKEHKADSEKKGVDGEKKSSSSCEENSIGSSQVVDEFVSFWGHPKPILIPKRLKDTTKTDDEKSKGKDSEAKADGDKPETKVKEISDVKEEKMSTETKEELSTADKLPKLEPEMSDEVVVPISEAETTVVTEHVQNSFSDSFAQLVGSGHSDEHPPASNDGISDLPDETTIGSSVEIHDDDDYPLLVIDEVSETVSDEKKKMTKKEKRLLKQQQDKKLLKQQLEKERSNRMDEVIAFVANAGTSDDEEVTSCNPVLVIDSVSNDQELDLSDVINQELKYDNKLSNDSEKQLVISDIVFTDKEKKKANSESVSAFSCISKEKRDIKPLFSPSPKTESDEIKSSHISAILDDSKKDDDPFKAIAGILDVSEHHSPEPPKLTEEELKRKEEEERKIAEEEKRKAEEERKIAEEEKRKAEEERKRKEEEEKARQEKEASDEAARAVESLLVFQSVYEAPIDLDDDIPAISPPERETPSESNLLPPTETIVLSPTKEKSEAVSMFSDTIPEKLTANLDDKLLENKSLEKGEQGENKLDAFSFFTTPHQAPGFTSPRRNSVGISKDKTPEPITLPSPQRQIAQSPQIPSPQRQMQSPQRQMQSPQRQMQSPQHIQSPQRHLQSPQHPVQSPLRPMQSPQIGLPSPLQSPQRSPFFNKDSKMDRSLMSPNRDGLFVAQDIESPAQQPHRRPSGGIPVLQEQTHDTLSSSRRKSQEFPQEHNFHSPRRNTITTLEEPAHLEHRFASHQGPSVIYSKERPLPQSSLPPPVSISLDNAPHDKNFQTPVRSLTIPSHQENMLLSPKKISPGAPFKDLASDAVLFQPSINKGPLQDQLFPSPKVLHDQVYGHQKPPIQDQLFLVGKGPVHDIFKSGSAEQQPFFGKGLGPEKPSIAAANQLFAFPKGIQQEPMFPQSKAVSLAHDRIEREPMFSPKGPLESSYYPPEQNIDFLLNSPPRNPDYLNYNHNSEMPKSGITKPVESHEAYNKDPLFIAVENSRSADRDIPQPRRVEGFPASFYQEPVPVAQSKVFPPDSLQQSEEDKKGTRKRKRNNKKATKEDRAAVLAEQAIEESVQANVETIHKILNAKKSVDAYDFEAHAGQEQLGRPNVSVAETHPFGEEIRQVKTRGDKGRGRGNGSRRGRRGRGALSSVHETHDSVQRHDTYSHQQNSSLPPSAHFPIQSPEQSQPKHPYLPYPFSSPQQHSPFNRQNSQPNINHQVTPYFSPSQPSSVSDNSGSNLSVGDWHHKSIPHHPESQPHQQLFPQSLQQPPIQQIKPPPKSDVSSPEPSKLDLDSSFGESDLVINLDDQPSSIEGKENQYSLSDGEVPSPATPKNQRSTRARKQPNYKAIASGNVPAQPQPRTARSGGSPRGRGSGAQSPKNSMSPRTRSSENVSASPVVKLEKLEVTRTTRSKKESAGNRSIKDDTNEEVGPNTSFEEWKAKKGDESKAVSKENIYEFVDNEQDRVEPSLRTTRGRKKRGSDAQEAQSQYVDYTLNSPTSSSNSSALPESKPGNDQPMFEPRLEEGNKTTPLSHVDAVIDAVSKGKFGSGDEDTTLDIPVSVPSDPVSTPSPISAPPPTRSSRRSTEAKREAEQKEKTTFTIAEPPRFEARELGKKGPTVPPLRIKVAHSTQKVEKNEEKHYVIERANKNIIPTSENSEKPPLAFTVKLSDTGTATIKPAGPGNGLSSVQNAAPIGKNQLDKNHLGLFSGLPQNDNLQPNSDNDFGKSINTQVSWKPGELTPVDGVITRPSGALHPKVAAKVQASQESQNTVPPVPALVQTTLPQQSTLPSANTAMPVFSKSSPSPILSGNTWTLNMSGGTPGQPVNSSLMPMHSTSPLAKDGGLMLQRPPSAHDIAKRPPSAHIQAAVRNERQGKGKHGSLEMNQEMAQKIQSDTDKLPEGPYGFPSHVPPAHMAQRFLMSQEQNLPSAHHPMHFSTSAAFKANLETRNSKSPSIQSQSAVKHVADLGIRTPPVTSAAIMYAAGVAGQPHSLSPTSASPEGQVIERLPNPLRSQVEAVRQSSSPMGIRMHPDARFMKEELESAIASSVGDRAPSREMMFRFQQQILMAQEAARNATENRNAGQDPSRSVEARNLALRTAHEQSRNTPVGHDGGRKVTIPSSQPGSHNQPLNLADSDTRSGDSSRVTPKSTPPAPQSPFPMSYLEPGRIPPGVASAFMQPSPSGHREGLPAHLYPDLPLGMASHPQFGMGVRLSIDPRGVYAPGHQPPSHLIREGVIGHFSGAFAPSPRFPVMEAYPENKESGHPEQVTNRGMLRSPSPSPILNRQAELLMKQQLTRMPCDLPTNSPVGILQHYPVMWQGALALKNDNSYVQMHFVAGNRRLPNLALPQPMQNGALPPLRISQRMRLEQAQLEGVAKRMQCEDDYCILIAIACGRDQSDIDIQTKALNDGFIKYLLQKQAAGIVNVPLPGSEQAGFVVHIFPPCEFVDSSVAQQGSLALMQQLSIVPHAVIIIATT
ncbi:uncharacterized protein LOC131942822 isoform X2 [Physella acuta]|uniref:uncharacterized protein LOC131942822 isoform X2 n=1 Tax=Physella acuta TaxID=109671 RepID=UPI0027DE7F7D|nr:uncharacterized protein LOC131942822 isoform X2 [Physella acuta]